MFGVRVLGLGILKIPVPLIVLITALFSEVLVVSGMGRLIIEEYNYRAAGKCLLHPIQLS